MLGNRTGLDATGTSNDVAYAWDAVTRMTSHAKGASLLTYRYRADGMRVQKIRSATDHTAYRYDGQMPMEEFNYLPAYPLMTTIKIIRYGLGARGVDLIERTQAGGTVLTGFPVYDGHGTWRRRSLGPPTTGTPWAIRGATTPGESTTEAWLESNPAFLL